MCGTAAAEFHARGWFITRFPGSLAQRRGKVGPVGLKSARGQRRPRPDPGTGGAWAPTRLRARLPLPPRPGPYRADRSGGGRAGAGAPVVDLRGRCPRSAPRSGGAAAGKQALHRCLGLRDLGRWTHPTLQSGDSRLSRGWAPGEATSQGRARGVFLPPPPPCPQATRRRALDGGPLPRCGDGPAPSLQGGTGMGPPRASVVPTPPTAGAGELRSEDVPSPLRDPRPHPAPLPSPLWTPHAAEATPPQFRHSGRRHQCLPRASVLLTLRLPPPPPLWHWEAPIASQSVIVPLHRAVLLLFYLLSCSGPACNPPPPPRKPGLQVRDDLRKPRGPQCGLGLRQRRAAAQGRITVFGLSSQQNPIFLP